MEMINRIVELSSANFFDLAANEMNKHDVNIWREYAKEMFRLVWAELNFPDERTKMRIRHARLLRLFADAAEKVAGTDDKELKHVLYEVAARFLAKIY